MRFPLIRNNFSRNDLDEVIQLLSADDPRLTNGPKVLEFEKAWSDWLGVKHSLFVNSGSSANLLSMAALRLEYPEGGEVIVPAHTWVSDISSVIQCGFEPVFVDINLKTLGMNRDKVFEAISENTRAVFFSHIQGFNGFNTEFLERLDDQRIKLIEDVCESHGATHCNQKLGSFGWMSNFSFYYAHHMSTIEGGMVCTNDTEVYSKLRMLRSHGMVREIGDQALEEKWASDFPDLNPQFIFAFPSYNVRNTEIGAVLGLSQLKRLDENNRRRSKNLNRFLSTINSEKFLTDFYTEGSCNYAFNLILREADSNFMRRVFSALDQNEIEYRVGGAGGGNQLRQPYLRDLLPHPEYFTEFHSAEHMHFYGCYIGNFPELTFEEVDFICQVINDA